MVVITYLYNFEPTTYVWADGQDSDTTRKIHIIGARRTLNDKFINNITTYTWSDENGQDDISKKEKEGQKVSGTSHYEFVRTINSDNYKHSVTYNMHIYSGISIITKN